MHAPPFGIIRRLIRHRMASRLQTSHNSGLQPKSPGSERGLQISRSSSCMPDDKHRFSREVRKDRGIPVVAISGPDYPVDFPNNRFKIGCAIRTAQICISTNIATCPG